MSERHFDEIRCDVCRQVIALTVWPVGSDDRDHSVYLARRDHKCPGPQTAWTCDHCRRSWPYSSQLDSGEPLHCPECGEQVTLDNKQVTRLESDLQIGRLHESRDRE